MLLNHLNLLTIESPHPTCTILAHSDNQLRELREGRIKFQQSICYWKSKNTINSYISLKLHFSTSEKEEKWVGNIHQEKEKWVGITDGSMPPAPCDSTEIKLISLPRITKVRHCKNQPKMTAYGSQICNIAEHQSNFFSFNFIFFWKWVKGWSCEITVKGTLVIC